MSTAASSTMASRLARLAFGLAKASPAAALSRVVAARNVSSFTTELGPMPASTSQSWAALFGAPAELGQGAPGGRETWGGGDGEGRMRRKAATDRAARRGVGAEGERRDARDVAADAAARGCAASFRSVRISSALSYVCAGGSAPTFASTGAVTPVASAAAAPVTLADLGVSVPPAAGEHPPMLADSVRRKRKHKMNKHKHRCVKCLASLAWRRLGVSRFAVGRRILPAIEAMRDLCRCFSLHLATPGRAEEEKEEGGGEEMLPSHCSDRRCTFAHVSGRFFFSSFRSKRLKLRRHQQ